MVVKPPTLVIDTMTERDEMRAEIERQRSLLEVFTLKELKLADEVEQLKAQLARLLRRTDGGLR